MKVVSIVFLCICLLLTSCKHGTEEGKHIPNPTAIELNNRASQLIFQNNLNEDLIRVDSILYEALDYTEEAIRLDSMYYMAYSNKATILCKLHKFQEAIDALELVLKFKPYYAEGIQSQGFIYEKMNKPNLAREKYSQALRAYDHRINKGDNELASLSSKAFLLIFIENKDAAIEEIDNLIERFPNNQEVLLMKQTIANIDKEAFIANYN